MRVRLVSALRRRLMATIQTIAIDTLKPNARNARTHPKKQIEQIAQSIKTFGFLVPILIDDEGTWRGIGELLEAAGLVYGEILNLVVWAKSNAGQGSFYRSAHELIGVFRVGEQAHLNNIQLGRHGRNRSNIWHYPGANTFRAGRLDDLKSHPTVKPVALVADAMKDCTRRGDIVLDTFCGSGTTILAAERVGRRAYTVEFEPRFVDVAIRGWQVFSRKDAIDAGTGLTFDQAASERREAPAAGAAHHR
jgi:hypothetical protein